MKYIHFQNPALINQNIQTINQTLTDFFTEKIFLIGF